MGVVISAAPPGLDTATEIHTGKYFRKGTFLLLNTIAGSGAKTLVDS